MLPPFLWGALFLFAWEQFVNWRHMEPTSCRHRRPSGRLSDNRHGVWDTARVTGTNAVIGLLVGALLGVGVTYAATLRLVGELLRPLSAALNAMPIIALGPMFYNMFIATSALSRRVVVTIVVFFPVFAGSAAQGLTQVDPVHAELMRSSCTPRPTPTSSATCGSPTPCPSFFTGLRIS